MRDLIKPTLFIVARLGVFLAVVAWAVSHRYESFGATPFAGAALSCQGWVVIAYHDASSAWMFVRNSGIAASINMLFSYPNDVGGSMGPSSFGFSFRGVSFQHYPGVSVATLPHWLVVTSFALFYGVLKWVYRKRPEVQPCES